MSSTRESQSVLESAMPRRSRSRGREVWLSLVQGHFRTLASRILSGSTRPLGVHNTQSLTALAKCSSSRTQSYVITQSENRVDGMFHALSNIDRVSDDIVQRRQELPCSRLPIFSSIGNVTREADDGSTCATCEMLL